MLQQAATYAMRGMLSRELTTVVMQFPHWMLWAPMTPLIFAAARRHPLSRNGLGKAVLVHIALGLLAIVFTEGIYSIAFVKLEEVLHPASTQTRPHLLLITLTAVVARLVSGFVTYAAVLGLAAALDYQRRLRDRELRAAKLEGDLAQAQVQAIKMQVQPHFLFNTLHAITVLIQQDPAVAARMVTQLGDLLRHTLTRATLTEVPLRSELEILKLYLEIERMRFRDRLAVNFDVAPETLAALVPDLVLQPLAENAIKHGVARSLDGGTVIVRAHRDRDQLVLEIRDTGSGMAMDRAPQERIGLTTVRARLERLYGDAHSLTIERLDSGVTGCVARVRLPFHETPLA